MSCEASGTVHGTKQESTNAMLKQNARLKYDLSTQTWMPTQNNGDSEVKRRADWPEVVIGSELEKEERKGRTV